MSIECYCHSIQSLGDDTMDSSDYETIECLLCEEEKEVEKGTWALAKGMCEPCYCLYQGG
jgi:hypothetical protein